mmetsp:Transcript_3709/g.6558  ORF Transcript_3709/g.6558 Transcript_3709/m.6558 type:complete len:225 (-) Transcript_3709:2262-2936(-)
MIPGVLLRLMVQPLNRAWACFSSMMPTPSLRHMLHSSKSGPFIMGWPHMVAPMAHRSKDVSRNHPIPPSMTTPALPQSWTLQPRTTGSTSGRQLMPTPFLLWMSHLRISGAPNSTLTAGWSLVLMMVKPIARQLPRKINATDLSPSLVIVVGPLARSVTPARSSVRGPFHLPLISTMSPLRHSRRRSNNSLVRPSRMLCSTIRSSGSTWEGSCSSWCWMDSMEA